MTLAARATSPSHYQVLGHLAKGGMGEILLARRIGAAGFEKLVVLKRPRDSAATRSQALVNALIDEARLLARINHPNVCQVYDLEEADGQYFLALEFLEGLSFWAVLCAIEDAGARIEPRILCGLFEQVCDGLDAIHGLRARDGGPANVVHRDISPGNLFITEQGVVKILDLGIAKSTDSEELTPFGRIKGKLPYLSPEQASGRDVDARADVFALGLVLYDMARGKRAERDRIGALVTLELAGVPLAPIIARAAANDPDARYATAREMAIALREAGAASRAEIADWLARALGPQLAKRRVHAIEHEIEPATITNTLTLQSVIADVAADDPTRLVSRETERLVLPEHERPRRRIEPAPAPAAPPTAAPVPRPRARWSELALIFTAMTIVAILLVVTGRDPVAVKTPPDAAHVPAQAEAEAAAEAEVVVDAGVEVDASIAVAEPAQPDVDAAPPPSVERPKRKPPVADKPVADKPVVDKPPGMLTIDSRPFARVRIGGRELTTPIWRIELAAGRHAVEATLEDGRTQTRTVTIEPGRERKLLLDWSER